MRNRGGRMAVLLLVVGVVASVGWAVWPRSLQPLQASLVAAAAPEAAAGFARAEEPRTLHFPADAGPHEEFQTEWWYYTGNLTAAGGEHFGYELTFFRRALQSPAERVSRSSDLATDQVYMAHFALTSVGKSETGGTHAGYERFERGAGGLAGAQATPYRVWLDDWSVEEGQDGAVHLRAEAGQAALDLTLRPLKAPVPHGDRGYVRKGAQPGQASYYYSLTRIETSGVVSAQGRTFAVDGLSWMDHEFGTGAWESGLVGWDWFGLQLSDGSELVLYASRRAADGAVGPFSSGTLVAPDGSARHLRPEDFAFRATSQWRSPHTGALYPAGWTVDVPSAGLHLTVMPYLADQEMNVSVVYWEGAVKLTGTVAGRPVTGEGYVELTGYSGSLGGRF